jgi:predicted house-cleaning noncanonical NTP pyrophosphatase (MazG superfamily)
MPKLVRDLIPQIITKQGKVPVTRILDDEEYKKELVVKLIEEVDEFKVDQNIEELADIIEVFETILKVYNFTHEELKIVRAKKALERGVFKNKIFLEEIISVRE